MILGVVLEPFLPGLSGKILSFFSEGLNKEDQQKIYRGEWKVIDELFQNGGKLQGKPKALVPKIEDEVIEMLQEKLHQG